MGILSDPTPDMLAMPRFDDGAIDMQELLRRLAEQVVNTVIDAETDQLCGGGANSRNGYREHANAAHPEAPHRHEHPQGAEGDREDGSLQALQVLGERDRVEPGRRRRGARRKAPRRHDGTLRMARSYLRQVPPLRLRRLHRCGHGHRLRYGRLEARPGRRRGGHRVIRLVSRLPQEDPRPRR